MTIKEYPPEQLAAQPIGYWTGVANAIIIGSIRAALGEEDLTQPHWWILNHVAGAPRTWTRGALTAKLSAFDTQNLDFEVIYADLCARGWLTETDGRLTLTEVGEAGRQRAATRSGELHERTHDGIETAEYIVTLKVLRRMISNLGGNSDLP